MLKTEDIDKINSYKYRLSVFTDRVDFIDKLYETDVDKLLELRAFDADSEFRVYRSTVDSPFKSRLLPKSDDTEFFDDTYYLDIDTSVVDKYDRFLKHTIGGGIYHLPADNTMITVRYYYKYDDNGIAKKYDWRLVGFTDTEDKRWQKNKGDK